MSVKSVSFTDVPVGDTPTHIVIYRENGLSSAASASASATASAKVIDDPKYSLLLKKVDELTSQVETLSKRILHIELASEVVVKTTPFFGAAVAPEPAGLYVRRLSEPYDDSKTTFKSIVNGLVNPTTKFVKITEEVMEIEEKGQLYEVDKNQDEVVEVDEEVEEVEEEEVEEEEVEEEEVVEEEEEGEVVEEEVVEEEAVEMEEFEYKGVTYYKDSENLVYKLDDDGDLDDTPIGVWNEGKQKILKYKQ